jgi:hypothetical protein
MSEQFVALYSDEYGDIEAAGPFDTKEVAQWHLLDLVAQYKLREKDTLGVAKLVKP